MTCPVAEGDLLLQKYRVERSLGAGGMGTVVAARHQQLGHQVAIKLMHLELNETEYLNRFQREGQLIARLRSPHVARVLDVGLTDSGAAYLVMEYLEGCDLEKTLEQRGALPISEAIDYLLQTCEAVAEAHAAGIVHRDLKPENLFLTYDSYGRACIKVLDFGISKVTDASNTSNQAITAKSLVIGTPLYMPPEQMRGAHEVDARADIWALGVILYELVTGKPAWSGSTLSEVCVRVATDPAPLARAQVPSLPAEVDEIITTCLQKDPEQRYQTVFDLAQALAALEPDVGVPALACMRQLLWNEPLPPSTTRSSGIGRRLGSSPELSDSRLSQGTSTSWGEHRASRPSVESAHRHALSWKFAPAILLGLVGAAAGVFLTHWYVPANAHSDAAVWLGKLVPADRKDMGTSELPERALAQRLAETASLPEEPSPTQFVTSTGDAEVLAQRLSGESLPATKVTDLPVLPRNTPSAAPVTMPKPKTAAGAASASPASNLRTRGTINRTRRESTSTPDWGGRK